uniref:NADH dehydrogenase subunit 2 n=1 Tax=Pleurosicya micheli TaxID=595630 RepID=UPI0028FC7A04|nr:NADH dehydrogenase subunit 2 [Pleurosicya micheli]WNH38095.1 NADH dehydrogenase subunit 2 [Pleurosicya micheli]
MPIYLKISVTAGLTMGTMMALSFHNWFLAWMGMEISAISMIPLLTHQNQPRMLESAIKYFVAQAVGTGSLVGGILWCAHTSGGWSTFSFHPAPLALITLALSLKLGMVPLHTWFVEVMQGASLYTMMVLATVPKIAPLALMARVDCKVHLMVILGLFSILFAGLAALNQTQLRKIMAYSSISHMGWVMVIMWPAPQIAMMTLTWYIIITLAVLMMCANLPAKTTVAIGMTTIKFPNYMLPLVLTLISLAGLPPMSGFIGKFTIFFYMLEFEHLALLIPLIIGSLLSLFFYVRLMFSAAATTSPSNLLSNAAWDPIEPPHKPLPVIYVLACFSLPLTPLSIAIITYLMSR